MSRAPDDRLIIGWKEYVGLPEWGIRRLKAKIDTGARTSALDVSSYTLQEVEGQGLIAELRIVHGKRRAPRWRLVRVPVARMVVVCNSAGMREQRPLVEIDVRLGPIVKRISVTVTNRAAMLFRMILGRQALAGDFVVDVSRKYLLKDR